MELHAQARVAVPPTLPLDVERTETVRPGPSGSANHMELHARARVAVPTTWNCTLGPEWQCPSHCHSASNVPAARPHTATRRRAYRQHALTLPLDVKRTETVRPGPSGSANHMELHAQARVAVPPTLPLDVKRTETVRSGPSGSANHMELHARARVAVPLTLPLDVERTKTVRPGPSGSAAHTAARRRTYWQHALTLPLDVERTEDVALPPGDLAYAKVVALPRVVPGHPRLAGPMTSSGNVPL